MNENKIWVERYLKPTLINSDCEIENVEIKTIGTKAKDIEKRITLDFLVITFKGGALSVRNITGNSRKAILGEISKLVYGYYTEVAKYQDLLNSSTWQVIE